ncbi:MAG: hypothetical protein HY820_41580 [Acidobacteria bacterium]|nr:hypothetical protein [Acidobacteriota bacterium]
MDKLTDPRMPSHPLDETLEAYVFERLAEPELDSLEDHLLICDACRLRLQETETYISAMKQAGKKLRDQDFFRAGRPSFWERLTSPMLDGSMWSRAAIGAGMAVAVLGVVLLVPGTNPAPSGYQDVSLTATRGLESPSGPSADAWLRLHLNVEQLPPFAAGVALIVDAGGRQLWQSKPVAAAGEQELVVPLDRKLARGSYWVRLVSIEGGQVPRNLRLTECGAGTAPCALLREYPLRVQ